MEEISLKLFQKKYSHHINKGLSFHTLEWVRDSYQFDFDVFLKSKNKNLQRDFCWTHSQKQALIYTMLRDQKINPIVVVQYKETGYETGENSIFSVIDGKQRLSTAFAYINNEFSIDILGKEFFFKDLPLDCQKQILHYSFLWDVHYSYEDDKISDDILIDIFEECNFLGTPQDIEHLKRLKDD